VPERALITGASAGLGLELARLFAADKSDLVLVARRAEELEKIASELRAQHAVDVRVLTKDLAHPDAAQDLAHAIARDRLEIDVLVNNAGFGARGLFKDLDLKRQLDIIQVNIAALTHLTRLFLPGMLSRRRGGVLNVASTAAFQPGPNMAVYYASKSYVLHFTEALREECRGSGVTISAFCPGPTATEFQQVAGMTPTAMYRAAVMTAGEAARKGYRGFRRGKTIVIPGFQNKLGAFLAQLGPRGTARRVAGKLNS
jgi:hypothetical protein